MKNYYEFLEIEKNSSQEEISWAYSRLALKFHPKKNEQKDFIFNNFKFAQIAEAYEVLANCK
jgi:DnaJ-class molecular chaperone